MGCEHKYEVAVVVASECALGVPLSLGAVVNNIWRWTVVDPMLIPVYWQGRRVKELGRMRPGTMATLVNQNCVLCSDGSTNNGLLPALVWFGSGGFAPCVRGASGQVVGLKQVWLSEEEREVRCLDSLELGEEVLAWGWGGKQGEGGTVHGVAFKPNETSSADSLTMCLAGDEEDPYFEIVFSGLVMRIGVDEGSLEEMEKLWQLILEEEARSEEGARSSVEESVPVVTLTKSSMRNSLPPLLEAIPEEGGAHEDQVEDTPVDDLHADSGFLEQSPSKRKVLQDFLTFLDFPSDMSESAVEQFLEAQNS